MKKENEDPYHSALFDELGLDGELDYYEEDGNILFTHDIMDGVHDEFQEADVIYSELAWRQGYEEFYERIDEEPEYSYREYLLGVLRVIVELGVPSYIVTGKHALKTLAPAESFKKMEVEFIPHGKKGTVCLYNGACLPYVCDSTIDVMEFVTDEFDCVLDFNCGYGSNLVDKVIEKDGRFIGSDINPQCIYYIAREFFNYEG